MLETLNFSYAAKKKFPWQEIKAFKIKQRTNSFLDNFC